MPTPRNPRTRWWRRNLVGLVALLPVGGLAAWSATEGYREQRAVTPHQVVRVAPGEQLRLPSTTVRVLSVRAVGTEAAHVPDGDAAEQPAAATGSSATQPVAGTAVSPPPGSRVWLLELASSSPTATCGVTLADAAGRRYGANPDELGTAGSPGCASATEAPTAPTAGPAGPAGRTAAGASGDGAASSVGETATGSAGDVSGRETVQRASFLLPADRQPIEVVIDYPTNAPYLGVLGIAHSIG